MKAFLPKLDYSYNALEPYIDSLTMKIHHSKHHQAYVDNFNKSIEGVKIDNKSAEDILKNINIIPQNLRQSVINNAGGHVNHSFFWKIMTPKKTKPEGKLLEILVSKFGSLDNFMQSFNKKALSLFGSGWVFLILDNKGDIKLKRHSFQNSPISHGNTTLLVIDLWEHAYYLKYQNKRADYIKAWWNVVNWDQVNENYLITLK